jgi:Leucine-rich repeat (LRR) protein
VCPLEYLGLARTQISRLPEWVFSIQKLRELDISYIEDRIPPAQIAHLRHGALR